MLSTDFGKYHSRTLWYAGSDVAGLGSLGRERMKPESMVDGFEVDWEFDLEGEGCDILLYQMDLQCLSSTLQCQVIYVMSNRM